MLTRLLACPWTISTQVSSPLFSTLFPSPEIAQVRHRKTRARNAQVQQLEVFCLAFFVSLFHNSPLTFLLCRSNSHHTYKDEAKHATGKQGQGTRKLSNYSKLLWLAFFVSIVFVTLLTFLPCRFNSHHTFTDEAEHTTRSHQTIS